MKKQTNLMEVFQKNLLIPNKEKLSDWVKDNVVLPNPPYSIGGPLDLSLSPYLLEPLNAMQDNHVREIVVCGSTRMGKSLIIDAAICYALLEEVGNILLIHHTLDKMKSWFNSRLSKLFQSNKKIKFSENRYDTTKKLINFPQLTLVMGGAQNANEMASSGYRYAFGDEIWLWKQGLVDIFKGRTKDFPYTKKILLVSSPSTEGEDFHNEWVKGQQAEFGFTCPKCGHIQPFVFSKQYPQVKGQKEIEFGGLVWESNETTKPQGVWNITEAEKTAHYKCINEQCKARFEDTQKDKRVLLKNYAYIIQNPSAPKDIVSYRFNSIASLNITYAEMVREFLTARKLAKNGKYAPLKTFYTEYLGLFWRDTLAEDEIQPLSKVGEDDEEQTPADLILFGTGDVQESGNKIKYEIFSFSKSKKEANQISYGCVDNFEHLAKIFREKGVKDQNVLIDSGNMSREVYKQCGIHGHKGFIKGFQKKPIWFCWSATKGEEVRNDQYWHDDVKAYRWYSKRKRNDAGFGTKEAGKIFCPFYTFSNKVAKDTLKLLLDGKHEWKWYISDEAKNDKDYIAELNSETVKPAINRNGQKTFRWVKTTTQPNDYWDTSVLQVVAASVSGILS